MNRNFAKPREDMTPEFAPDAVVIDGRTILAPKAVHYAKVGYMPLRDERPTDAPDGKHWERQATIEADGDGYRWGYALVDNPPPTVADFDFAMEEHLRTEREARGYTTREPDAYLESSNARWRQDAHDWVAHRDAVMSYALDLINAVESGERQPPMMAEFKVGLPTIVWTFAEGV